MDIGVARTFLEIVKTGSFVNAANNLNISQTAVSARIRILEEQLERPMFVRNKSGAKLTAAGEQFFRYATSLVQIWEAARSTVALPPGRNAIVTIGAELSLWTPLMTRWLLWMRRECANVAIRATMDRSDKLVELVQEGLLDFAVLYGAPSRTGLLPELLFEEKLVLVRTLSPPGSLAPQERVAIDWGEDFAASCRAAFPDQPGPVVSISYGPLALEYILEAGGSGYFRQGFVQPLLEEGRLEIVPDSPEFSYPAYLVSSARADQSMLALIRTGLRFAATAGRGRMPPDMTLPAV